MKKEYTGTATYESSKDKADDKEISEMRNAKQAYFEERSKQLNSMK